ncbi:general negative regulator of transcription subunit 3-like protein isoform X2 [Tanacetum coccineum]|uniref:General negative regulator of transcription subunit 3-like protein isoform X2 n=1 Tax=Tanacetum coccineum TaxID=301880 RepID=A0ABQ5AL85_9ASTR
MGASRVLQGEIDRVLTKVQEGVDVFDSIWNKVYDTDNMKPKEKFVADLKKGIKKLQSVGTKTVYGGEYGSILFIGLGQQMGCDVDLALIQVMKR